MSQKNTIPAIACILATKEEFPNNIVLYKLKAIRLWKWFPMAFLILDGLFLEDPVDWSLELS